MLGAEVRLEPIRPIPEAATLEARAAALGERLFADPRLSRDGRMSCASCHDLARHGADGRTHPSGTEVTQGSVKTPTVYNSGLSFVQGWNGRAPTLEAMVGLAVTSPAFMGSSWSKVIQGLRSDAKLNADFDAVFDEAPTPETVTAAIAAFERSLVTPNSRFDRWLAGEDEAIDEAELDGYRLFKSYGCVSCHQGANVGGNMYGRMGLMGDYFADRGGEITPADLGRFTITGLDEDRHLFKVPSLRLAVRNPPYFHDGSTETLAEAIRVMARYQLGRSISDEHVAAIERFLTTLVGEHPRLTP
ncbi:cytochrome B6 [Thiorhodococcus mannitoliphagus]|uniref:Cytochrome B6 n=2 Tax=Thiorhodococcus mannitoliphagus TaxID=329406 RepID=A0A6P1DWX6_9GAMM|nr:cytochrome c peroxidase [Thiorhodococcus mannitoliphagus]NEX21623.1 cytochrome B6 [Thiorhodococcus mannitoliphagus]